MVWYEIYQIPKKEEIHKWKIKQLTESTFFICISIWANRLDFLMLWKKFELNIYTKPERHRVIESYRLDFHLFKLIKPSYGLISLSIQGYHLSHYDIINLKDNIDELTNASQR